MAGGRALDVPSPVLRLAPKLNSRRRPLFSRVAPYLMVLPAAAFLFAFTLLPMARTVLDSANEPSGNVGWANYQALLDDPIFWTAVRNNALFAIGTVPTSIALAMLMAMSVVSARRRGGVMRLAFFTPTILPLVVAGSIWLYFYTPGYGPVNQMLALFGVPSVNWLGDPGTALPALMVATVWKEAGLFMIFYLAGLQSLSSELREASMLEGAGRWSHFRRVVFPLMMPTTFFVTLVATVNAFKSVDMLFVTTRGGPNHASSLLLYYIYEVAFRFLETNFAAALSVVLVGVLVIVGWGQVKLLDRRVFYQ
jgi:sn-glycerol 3-phosphate transport system permease protein